MLLEYHQVSSSGDNIFPSHRLIVIALRMSVTTIIPADGHCKNLHITTISRQISLIQTTCSSGGNALQDYDLRGTTQAIID